jgi:hypothetical protein
VGVTGTEGEKEEIKVALRTQNTIQNIIKQHPRTDKYNRSGIYQMKFLDCPLRYIGQKNIVD